MCMETGAPVKRKVEHHYTFDFMLRFYLNKSYNQIASDLIVSDDLNTVVYDDPSQASVGQNLRLSLIYFATVLFLVKYISIHVIRCSETDSFFPGLI